MILFLGWPNPKGLSHMRGIINLPHPRYPQQFTVIKAKRITISRLFQCINSFLKGDVIVLADVGDALFASTDLVIRRRTEFLSSAYYASMGFAVPASIGAQLANPRLRPHLIVGDGAFHMTGMEISTALRFNLNPIVLVLNNRGYGTERSILDGPFNDIPMWQYSFMPQLVGGGKGFAVETEGALGRLCFTLKEMLKVSAFWISIRIHAINPALQRLEETFRKSAIKACPVP